MIDNTVALFLAPVGLFLLWLMLVSLLGRRPRRFTLNVVLSLLLLLYFLSVAGTGIFWVAKQELPVFDWHYLLGYILLLLVVVHIALNWRHVTAFMRTAAPATTRTRDGKRFRAWVSIFGWGVLAAVLGTSLFIAGEQYGGETFIVHVSPESREDAGAATIPIIKLEVDGMEVSMAEHYHRGSSYPSRSRLSGVTWQSRPSVYKEYDSVEERPLPESKPDGGGSLLEAVQAWRGGCSRFAPSSMTVDELSLILFHAQGITRVKNYPGGDWDFRAAPSAGALYPTDLYLVVNRVEGIDPGLYHYNVKRHSLVPLRLGSFFESLESLAGSPHYYQPAAVTMVASVTYGRTGFKYRERAYRYVNMDTGHVVFQLGVVAASLGFSAPVVARFDDRALDALLDIDGETESSLLLMPLGRPLELEQESDLPEPRFESELRSASGGAGQTFASAIHSASSLCRIEGWTRFPSLQVEGLAPLARRQTLPDPSPGDALYPTIRARRSTREYSALSLELDELSALCVAAVGTPEESLDPLHSGSAPINLYAVVRDVGGLAPGVYRYQPESRALALVEAGDFSARCRSGAIDQEFCGTADVLFVKTVLWSDLLRSDGDRGYRYACIRSGIVGGALYLQAAALGLGVCGVGAFEDEAIAGIIGCEPEHEAVLYLTAVGR